MTYDFIIIGAGIAGASAAYELSKAGSVLLLEREARPAYHTTGRSAAFFTLNYGNTLIRSLTAASRDFLFAPPDIFGDAPLLEPRPTVTIARADQAASFEANLAAGLASPGDIAEIDIAEAEAMIPVLRPGYAARAHIERDSYFMDVDLIHGGFLRGFAAHGGRLATDAEVKCLARRNGAWRVETRAGNFEAPVVINAAGAWADEVAALAGARPVGIEPRRRTVIVFAAPNGLPIDTMPLVIDADEQFYFKPEAGKILASPADETPSPPCDAQPEEIDIALVADRLARASTLEIRHIEHKWAGLRSFAPDRSPVVGADPNLEGFIWLAGQGGYGIMTSPAMSRAAAALATGGAWPEGFGAMGIDAAALAPGRAGLAN
jgi:D-arginine dehydrogenase